MINIVQKLKHHFYHHCDKAYITGQELRDAIMTFFGHISGEPDDETVDEWQQNPEWKRQVNEMRQFCDPLLSASKLDNLTAGMFTSRIETFHSVLLMKAPKTKLFLATMQARIWAAILEWNETHISEACLKARDAEQECLTSDERRDREAQWRRNWFDRVWKRILAAGVAPRFPELDDESDENDT